MIRIDGFGRALYFGVYYLAAVGGNLDADALATVSSEPRGGVSAALPATTLLSAAPRGGITADLPASPVLEAAPRGGLTVEFNR